jgi:2-dehydropantoate 2-reductase
VDTFGGRLAVAGNDVIFVARGSQLEAIRQNGLTILSSNGDQHLQPVRVVERVAELEPVDLVLVTVKLWDTEDVARTLRPLVDRGAAVLSLQNGVDKDDILRKYLPAESVIGGVCYIATTIAVAGIIRHTELSSVSYSGSTTGSTRYAHKSCWRPVRGQRSMPICQYPSRNSSGKSLSFWLDSRALLPLRARF